MNRLYDPRNGDRALLTQDLRLRDSQPFEPFRTNYFSIYLLEEGTGSFWADATCQQWAAPCLLFFVPYQQIRLEPERPVQGSVLYFHANFLCVETFHAEVGCSGLLFNDRYGSPSVSLDEKTRLEIVRLMECIQREERENKLAHEELMLASLKILLILASRQKTLVCHDGISERRTVDFRHPALGPLRDLIEQNFQVWHSPADYARALQTTPKSLGRVVREHLGTTLTELIRSRILSHTKWQLLHTLLPVKEIARNAGFSDELYFSRLFKKATGCSPTFFRNFETEIRGGSNLSMSSSAAPLQRIISSSDTEIITAD